MQLKTTFGHFFESLRVYTNSYAFEEDLNEILNELNPEGFQKRFGDKLYDNLSAKKDFFLSEVRRRIFRGAGNGVLLSIESARTLQQLGTYLVFTIGSEVMIIIIVCGRVFLRRLIKNEKGTYDLVPEDTKN